MRIRIVTEGARLGSERANAPSVGFAATSPVSRGRKWDQSPPS
jgi:hypothetical protein